MKSHLKISFLAFLCSKYMYSANGNYTLDISFYKKETEVKKRFSAFLTKSKRVAFSHLFSIENPK